MSCRLCLKKGDSELSVLEDDICNKIKTCISVDVRINERFPIKLCTMCYKKLNELWLFRSMCLESEKILSAAQKNDTLHHYTEIQEKIDQFDEQCSDSEDSSDDGDCFFPEETDLQITYPNDVYRCDICQIEFDQVLEYLDHQSEHDGSPVFKCDKCNVVLSTRSDLVRHDQNHKVTCNKCGKVMKKSSLKLHLIGHTDQFKCLQCSTTCNSRVALEQHKITVHTDIRSFICENCGKNFPTASSLRTHLLSHSEERKYPCKFCDYAGRTASAIYIHMAKHANDTCICEVCSKVFKSNRNLNDHIRRVHAKVKKHVCAYCSRKFVNHYRLKVHVRIHTGLRPYKCTQCEKSFFRSDGLKEHMVVHEERTMHECEKCHKQYMSKRGVSRHNCPASNS